MTDQTGPPRPRSGAAAVAAVVGALAMLLGTAAAPHDAVAAPAAAPHDTVAAPGPMAPPPERGDAAAAIQPAGSAPTSSAATGAAATGTSSGWLRLSDSARARYAPAIREMSDRYGVSTSLVEAVIRVESAFNHLAISPKGARGLMQLMPQTAQALGVLDSFNPRQNIEGGVRYLRRLLDRYPGELKLALAAYNAGEGAVDAYRGIPPYPETQQYVKRVLQADATATSRQGPASGADAPAPAIAPSPPPRRISLGQDQPLPAVPLIDEARRATHAAPSVSASGTLSMRSPNRLSQESVGDALARMKQQSRLSQ